MEVLCFLGIRQPPIAPAGNLSHTSSHCALRYGILKYFHHSLSRINEEPCDFGMSFYHRHGHAILR